MSGKLTIDVQFHISEYSIRFEKLRRVTFPGIESLISDYDQIKRGAGDDFFEKFGVGNAIFDVDEPFERARAYESLLNLLNLYDPKQYLNIHKGTPYYFLAWTAFQAFNFEKAMFYMDAAASEDIRRIQKDKLPRDTSTPALDFLFLNDASSTVGVLLNSQIRSVIIPEINRFNTSSGEDLKLEDFVDLFIKPLLFNRDKKFRAIITSLYSFFLEEGSHELYISLRSSEGGSIDPILSHLFKGARILESLLGLKSNKKNLYSKIIDLKNDLDVNQKFLKSNQSLNQANLLLTKLRMSDVPFQNYNFAASYIIRNTTGHSLIWSDEFKTAEAYRNLYIAITNSILWSIHKLW